MFNITNIEKKAHAMRANTRSRRTDSLFKILLTIIAAFILLLQFSAHSYAEEPALRPAHITILIDNEVWQRNKKNSTRETEEIINFVSEIFKKEFGITFILNTIKPFDFFLEDDEINLDANLEKIQQIVDTDYKESDIALGFTAKKQFRCLLRDKEGNITLDSEGGKIILKETPCPQKNKIYYGGFADQPGTAAISEFNKFIALHEMGHLFGAQHIVDDESVMNPIVINNAAFDAQNKEIIKQRIKEKFSIQNAP